MKLMIDIPVSVEELVALEEASKEVRKGSEFTAWLKEYIGTSVFELLEEFDVEVD